MADRLIWKILFVGTAAFTLWYVLNPNDLIPESLFLPISGIIGFLDDALAVAGTVWMFKKATGRTIFGGKNAK
jgi:uncharacterized membrane protein YkvA (DUF1232 family)